MRISKIIAAIAAVSSFAALSFVAPAVAADLPTLKDAPAFSPPAQIFSWTGIYAGVNAGVSGGNFTNNFDYYGAYYYTQGARSSGFSGGGQIGFNYQFANNIVLGFETDFQGSTLKGTYYDRGDVYGYVNEADAKVDWWGTARGRIGYAFGNILPYATGGFAYGRLTNDCHINQLLACSYGNYSWSSMRTGWTAGGGLEYALTHNLTVKVEYLYTDLGSWHSEDPHDVTYFPGLYQTVKTNFQTVRAGLNYKFDWLAPPVPVVAKY
jgi:outer membrane immunogenic protein